MRVLTALAGLLLLASCQKPLTVLVVANEKELLELVRAEVNRQPNGKDIVVTDDPALAEGSGNLLVLGTQLGWNLPKEAPAPAPLPKDWDKTRAYSPVASLALWGQEGDGSWGALPLFFDAYGVTVFRKEKDEAPLPPQDWTELLATAPIGSLVVDGSRPAFRQSSVFLTEMDKPGVPGGALSWFGQRPAAWETPLANLGPQINHRAWAPETWHFARADLLSAYGPADRRLFLETFRDYERTNAAGNRVFQPLRSTEASGYAMAGPVLFLQFRGDRGQIEADLPLVRALSGPDFQKEVSLVTKWLGANMETPEIDATGAMVRRLAQAASRFYPVTDDLPRPLVENNLFVNIQLAIDRTPRK